MAAIRLGAAILQVCNSTCCNNTAPEHAMMERLIVDDLVHWARSYKVFILLYLLYLLFYFIILLFYYFIILLFYYFIILLFCYFVILLFCYFVILSFYYFIILLFYYFIILLFYYLIYFVISILSQLQGLPALNFQCLCFHVH